MDEASRTRSSWSAPNNKRKFHVIVVGSGLAGASAAASLAELGYNVDCFTFHDSPRRAHSIAAQGGINAAKNYQNDGDSVFRLFYDTIKGGDFRSREANVYRLAEVSTDIIDQCVAQGVPFAREYGGLLDNRSFGGAQVSRTFYCRGQTGQQLLLGAYQALSRQIAAGQVKMHTRCEMLDLVVVDGHAKGIITRDLITGEGRGPLGRRRRPGHRRLQQRLLPLDERLGLQRHGQLPGLQAGGLLREPLLYPDPPDLHPGHRRQAGEADIDVASRSATTAASGCRRQQGDSRPPGQIPEAERDYYLERKYPSFGNLAPRDIASRAAKQVCDEGRGVGQTGWGSISTSTTPSTGWARRPSRPATATSSRCTTRSPTRTRTGSRCGSIPRPHYTMGGLWVDYNLMSNLPGLFVIGEANFSDHGANRLGASALMQGLADGYFILPYTIGDYFARVGADRPPDRRPRVPRGRGRRPADGSRPCSRSTARPPPACSTASWDGSCGRSAAWPAMPRGSARRSTRIPEVRDRFWSDVQVPGSGADFNQALEYAGRVADYLEFAEVLCHDCPQPQRVMRRPLPRGVPDARRRSPARRRELYLRRRLGA